MIKYLSALVVALMVMITVPATARDLYATGSVGTTVKGSGDTALGLAFGMEAHKNLRVEAAYEYNVDNKNNKLFAHAIPQVTIPGTAVTPYLLAGVGVDLKNVDSKPLYALGGGVRVGLSKSTDLDLRYRRVDNTDNTDKREIVSAGISIKF